MRIGKATKKPVEIDYFGWEGRNDFQLEQWVKSFGQKYLDYFISTENEDTGELNLYVKTLEGTSYIVPKGYTIIRGVKGEYYPCETIIFLETYNIK